MQEKICPSCGVHTLIAALGIMAALALIAFGCSRPAPPPIAAPLPPAEAVEAVPIPAPVVMRPPPAVAAPTYAPPPHGYTPNAVYVPATSAITLPPTRSDASAPDPNAPVSDAEYEAAKAQMSKIATGYQQMQTPNAPVRNGPDGNVYYQNPDGTWNKFTRADVNRIATPAERDQTQRIIDEGNKSNAELAKSNEGWQEYAHRPIPPDGTP
jgi:hypothetical protein